MTAAGGRIPYELLTVIFEAALTRQDGSFAAEHRDVLLVCKQVRDDFQPLLYHSVRGVIPSARMDNLARTLADNPELGNGVEELDLSMLKPDVEDEIALAVARKGARTTARAILRRVKPTTLDLTLADEDSQNILAAVKEDRLKYLTLHANRDNASSEPHIGHNLNCWRRFVGRVINRVETLQIEGLQTMENAYRDIVESDDEDNDATRPSYPAKADFPLKALALPACGHLEQVNFLSEALHPLGLAARSPQLSKCVAARLSVQHFAVMALPGLMALTHLRILLPSRAANSTTLMRIYTRCPNITELHLGCDGLAGVSEIVFILWSLADSETLEQLAVLTFTQVEAFTADANNAAVTWRHGPRDKVELRLQHVSQAEWDRL